MNKIAITFALFTLISIPAILFNSCEKETETTGKLHLSITDAPIDLLNVTGVFITITEIQYHHNGTWKVLDPFEGPQTYNLLDLTHGISEMLGSFELESGSYTQIRFIVDAPVLDGINFGNPGCYLVFDDETTVPLFIPSGAQTGFKATGNFDVPVNGDTFLTADFDVRRSVVVAGSSGKFILKPTIRLVVDNQAGIITGNVLNFDSTEDITIYAYEQGTYQESESNDPEPEMHRFPNAISSDIADENGDFTLAFMAAGSYDLIITRSFEGNFLNVAGITEGINVESEQTTTITIDISLFE